MLCSQEVHLVATGTGLNGSLHKLDLVNRVNREIKFHEILHKRLGHLSYSGMQRLTTMVTGLEYDGASSDCISCIFGKEQRQQFSKNKVKRAKELLNLVHTDTCGPMNVSSLGGALHFLCFINDMSIMSFLYLLKNKSERSL